MTKRATLSATAMLLAVILLMAPSVLAQDYKAFWYEIETTDKGIERVDRKVLSHYDYTDRKQEEVQIKWYPRFEAWLNGNMEFAAADEDEPISAEQAEIMIRLDDDSSQRLQDNPIFLTEMAMRMAEWTVFFDQLELWQRYVEESVIREALTEEEQVTFEPTVVDAELEQVYTQMTAHAQEVVQTQEWAYEQVVKAIRENTRQKEEFDNWVHDREQAMLDFADKWGRKFDGSQIEIGKTVYFVRNEADRPDRPEEDSMKAYLPRNGVLIEVPQEKNVTPYDLINPDGTLKKPEGMQ